MKTSDAKLFLIKLQQEDGKSFSSFTFTIYEGCYDQPFRWQWTMNVYTHISFDDAEEELRRMEEVRKAQAEVDKGKETNAVSQKMFKVV